MKKVTRNILIGSVVLTALVLSLSFFKKRTNQILLLGGLDTRSSDKKINEQEDLIKKGLSRSFKIKSFRYNEPNKIIEELKLNPNSYIVLFSAGCNYSEIIAKELKIQGGKLNKIFILEPYHVGGKATNSVKNAVNLGVPENNVFVGTNNKTGLGIVKNSTKTPSCSPKHWCSLTEVAKLISKK